MNLLNAITQWLSLGSQIFNTDFPRSPMNWGNLRWVMPFTRNFGYARGTPVDRYYIEQFLSRHAADIHGRTLEIGDDSYTRQFGGARVHTRDVLHVQKGHSAATFHGDLTHADHLPDNAFDCFICTQTLHLIYDTPRAISTIQRILKPGGVLLATFPGISQLSKDRWARGWYWGFTALSAKQLFNPIFPPPDLAIESRGNRLSATALLLGIPREKLLSDELDDHDPAASFLITVRAVKAVEAE